jgi:hypothetical protein
MKQLKSTIETTLKTFWLRLCYYKNEPLMVNFKFAKFHCYQQIQSFLITPYVRSPLD